MIMICIWDNVILLNAHKIGNMSNELLLVGDLTDNYASDLIKLLDEGILYIKFYVKRLKC